jgi:putative toxin-antitoxin system antitoxin component (TIGR02293 family)
MDPRLHPKSPRSGRHRPGVAPARVRMPTAASYLAVFLTEPDDRIAMVRRGVPAVAVGAIARDLGVPKTRLYRWLGLKPSTAKRKGQLRERLSPGDSEAVLGLSKLVGQVQALVAESASREFDAARWVARWVETPLPALGGKAPAEYLDTREGQELVARLLNQSASGVYA